MPIDARCRQRVEVGNVRCIQFQKAAGIAFAPTVEGTAFEHEDLIGTRSDVDCIDHVIVRCMRSNVRLEPRGTATFHTRQSRDGSKPMSESQPAGRAPGKRSAEEHRSASTIWDDFPTAE
jgi:hypothetical protein